MKSVLASVVISAFFVSVAGCRSAPPAEPVAQHAVPVAQSAVPVAQSAVPAASESTPTGAHAAPPEGSHAAPQPGASGVAAPNRDPHGDPDVGRYVARLASPEGVAVLAGNRIVGPAIVTQMDATTLILPGHAGVVDSVGTILIRPL